MADPSIPRELEELLSACIDLTEARGEAAVEELLAGCPEHAEEARIILRSLRGMGLVEEADTKPFVERLGEFRLLQRLGQGAMGSVFLARQESVDRLCAVKVVHPQLASSQTIRERFRREAHAVAKLDHPNIVTVYGSGEHDGLLWIAMEFVPGKGLDELLAEERPDVRQVLHWVRDTARALQSAHDAGILHRDVKPSNIRVTTKGRAMLLDFGLAKDLEKEAATLTAGFTGSPHYASPEQVAGGSAPIGPATDVYSLGVTLFESVSGKVPYDGETTEQVFQRILEDPLPRIRAINPTVPRDLETVICKAIEREPGRRYADAGAFADDLDALLELRPIAARPPTVVRRAHMWARRNKIAATAIVSGTVAVAGLAVALALERRGVEVERAEQARAKLAEARAVLREQDAQRLRIVQLSERLRAARSNLVAGYHGRTEWARFASDERELDGLEEAQDRSFARVISLIERSEQLAPGLEGTNDLRADLYMDRWRLARIKGDANAARFLRSLVEQYDGGRYRTELEGRERVSIETVPAGADVWLFRYVEQSRLARGGEPRLVPVPHAGPVPRAPRPGTWCLRVVAPAGGIATTDLVYEVAGHPIEGSVLVLQGAGEVKRGARLTRIDGAAVRDMHDVERALRPIRMPWEYGRASGDTSRGEVRHAFEFSGPDGAVTIRATSLDGVGIRVGEPRLLAEHGDVPARVYRNGETSAIVLPRGLRVRTTAAPFLVTDAGRLDEGRRSLELAPGDYAVLIRAAGHETTRGAFLVPQQLDLRFVLQREGTSPPGFVAIHPHDDVTDPYWILEREVTCAEYLDFLNDSETLREIDSDPHTPRYFPRDASNALRGGYWQRTGSGPYRLGPGWRSDMPVLGVSWRDASAYAAWRTERAAAEGLPFVFRLPTFGQHFRASCALPKAANRRFVYGDVYCPLWFKACFSRATPCVEPVLRFPIDESMYGVFDLTGSAREWLRSQAPSADGRRWLLGGSWAHGSVQDFVDCDFLTENSTSVMLGFRLVAERK